MQFSLQQYLRKHLLEHDKEVDKRGGIYCNDRLARDYEKLKLLQSLNINALKGFSYFQYVFIILGYMFNGPDLT